MYCSNCGAKINENAVVCVKCGAAVEGKKVVQPQVSNSVNAPKNSSGAATASLVLGIIGLVIGVIMFFLSMCFYAYALETYRDSIYSYFSSYDATESIITVIVLMFLPALLSIIGLFLGIFSSTKGKTNKGAKIAGLVLNIITIVLCIIPIVLVAMI